MAARPVVRQLAATTGKTTSSLYNNVTNRSPLLRIKKFITTKSPIKIVG